MKTMATIARVLLGLLFAVFGANGFLHFLPPMPMPAGAISFFGALGATGYMLPLVFATQVVAGILLVVGVFVPLALTLLAPVIVNIFFFHLFLAPGGLPLAIVVIVLELFLVWTHRSSFRALLSAR
jgi:uncharacterized membrane protein YphA (DoxX/SURF4 family)